METSILLAKLIGPLFVIIAIGMIINPAHYRAMITRFISNPELYYLSGAISFVTGLAVVLHHNLWVADWRLAITILGWLAILKGVLRILFPTLGREVANTGLFSRTSLFVMSALLLILGAWLSVKGFA